MQVLASRWGLRGIKLLQMYIYRKIIYFGVITAAVTPRESS